MGKGAFLQILNNSSKLVTSHIVNDKCMHNTGGGSNLELFNGGTVPANGSLPIAGPQYIEAKNSGFCFGNVSEFTLTLLSDQNVIVGMVNIKDSGNKWSIDNQSVNRISVDIQTGSVKGNKDIYVTLLPIEGW
ncbi:hypothetical protein CEQ90_04610 [Lewinellaceae bacterium SD302]|nr:hypothetical protein CEQ90_04610 [Lewinellaceae bacterium SD302]